MSNKPDPMSPEASPGSVGKAFGGRRLNNMPLVIGGLILALFVAIIAYVAYGRRQVQEAPQATEQQKSKGVSTSAFAKAIVGDHVSGQIPAQQPQPPQVPADGKLLVERPSDADKPPSPPPLADAKPQLGQEQDRQILMGRGDARPNGLAGGRQSEQRQAQFEKAVQVRTTAVNLAGLRSNNRAGSADTSSLGASGNREADLARIAEVRRRAAAVQSTDPTAAYKARLAEAQATVASGGMGAGTGSPGLMQVASTSGRNDVNQFSGNASSRWKLPNKLEDSAPYTLIAGASIIPGTLISGIDSTLPGPIWGQVAQDICDSATGQHLLIPQGTRVGGAYSSDVVYGQANVLTGWQRLIFPNGKTLDLGSMAGSDQAGYSGFNDQVDNHYFRIFGSAFLMSGITAGVAMSQTSQTSTNGTVSARTAMTEALGQQLGQASAQMISKNLNIAPTLKIRPGYRFNIMVTKDIVFDQPYKKFGCMAKGNS